MNITLDRVTVLPLLDTLSWYYLGVSELKDILQYCRQADAGEVPFRVASC